MAFRFFTISVHDPESATGELNAFLARHKILAVDRRWVEQGSSSFWCLCVDYLESGQPASSGVNQPAHRNRLDYKEILTPQQFIIFAELRELRKAIALEEGTPVFTIFTNEQLAQMVQNKVTTSAALEKIAGVGEARVAKYGARILEVLRKAKHEANGEPVPANPRPG